MNHRIVPLSAGLYLCAVPIGNARDITLRALDILASADIIAAEDTRTARKLMEIHGISPGDRKMFAYHDHSGEGTRDKILAAVQAGQSVAYVSEAGTPLVADPGYKLASAMRDAGLPLTTAPGASAALAALTVSGMASDAFHFTGFLPNATGARKQALSGLKDMPATVILYESPKRIHGLLGDVCEVLGADRDVAVCRELTKKFEEVIRGTAAEVAEQIRDRVLKGEIVVLIARSETKDWNEDQVKDALKSALETMRIKDAATAVAGATGFARRDVYQLALQMKDET